MRNHFKTLESYNRKKTLDKRRRRIKRLNEILKLRKQRENLELYAKISTGFALKADAELYKRFESGDSESLAALDVISRKLAMRLE